MAGMNNVVSQMMIKVGADTSQAEQALGSLGVMLSKSGPLALGGVLLAGAIVGVGAASIKMAGDYQAGLTTLVTGAGEAAGKNGIGKVHDAILNMAVATGESTQQLISGMFMIDSAGYTVAKGGLTVLKDAAEGAAVGHADLMTVADALTTVMKDYNLGVNKAAMGTNLLVATVSLGKTHMEDLAGSISSVLPTAAKFGVSLSDVMAGMATMTAHGIAAANAATYLRQMIVSLEAPTSAGAKALASVGLSAQQVNDDIRTKGLPATLQIITNAIGKTFPAGSSAAKEAFKEIAGGSRQMQGMLALTGSTAGEFADDAKKLGGVVGSTSTQITGWSMVQGTFNLQAARAKEAVEVLMISLGEHLLPVATQLMNFLANNMIPTVQNFIKFITGTSQEAEKLRPILAVLGIAIAGALVAAFVAWAIAAGAAAVATIAATWPILAIGAGIALLIGIIVLLVQHWKQITAWFMNQDAVKMTIAGFQTLINVVKQVIGWFGDLFGMLGKVTGGIQSVTSNIGGAISGMLHLPHFASGGTMQNTGVALVGETEPEIVVMPGGAQVTPLSKLGGGGVRGLPSGTKGMSLLQGGATANQNGQPIQINLYLDGRKFATAMAQQLPSVVRQGTGNRSF